MSRSLHLPRPRCRIFPCRIEPMEARFMLSTVTVNTATTVRSVNANLLGVNLANWDSILSTSQTKSAVQAAGLDTFRIPGGSESDLYHFNVNPGNNWQPTTASFAQFLSSVNGTGMMTINYGTGSPQEGAAFLAYMEGSPTDTTTIGNGEQWNTSTNTWTTVNWKTVGYWATLRASAPLATDDGYNFMRISHPAVISIPWVEVGNEEYGVSWETDEHGQSGDTLPMPGTAKPAAHDPTTYVSFAKQFAAYANEIEPGVLIGIDSGSSNATVDSSWLGNVLTQCVSQGWTPGYISDHNYVMAPGSENDQTLLLDTVSDTTQNSSDPTDWAQRATNYKNVLNQYLGAAGANVQLLTTEFNSVYSNPGKQTTSLVNGLFVADSLGSLLETSYNGAWVWDLHNGWDTGESNSSSLYGWRQGGDYGILGSSGTAPSTGADVPYPTYFAEQLLSKMVHNGDTVVQSSSSSGTLAVYAVKQKSTGDIDLLVINKSSTATASPTITLNGITPGSTIQAWQYGETQDTAQSKTSNGASSLASSTPTITVNGSSFSYSFPQYSMTVLDIPATTPFATLVNGVLTVQGAAAAANSLSVSVNGSNIVAGLGGQTLSFASSLVNSIVVNGGTLNDTFTFTGPINQPTVFNGGGGNDTLQIAAGTYTFNADASTGTGSMTVTVASAATAIFNSTQHLASLTVNGSSTLSSGVLVVNSFTLGSGAKLDLTTNAMIVDYAQGGTSPLSTLSGDIQTGYNGGLFNATSGLTSSSVSASGPKTAIGILDNSQLASIAGQGYSTFDGIPVDSSSVLIRYTLSGDANLDGSVGLDDFNLLAAHLGLSSGQTWLTGDFTYDGGVGLDDFNLLAANLGTTLPGGGAVIPGANPVVLTPPKVVKSAPTRTPAKIVTVATTALP